MDNDPLGCGDIRDDLLNPLLIQYGPLDWSIIMHPNMFFKQFIIQSKLFPTLFWIILLDKIKNKKYITKN